MQKHLFFLFFFITLCVKPAAAAPEFYELRFKHASRANGEITNEVSHEITVTLVVPEALRAQEPLLLAKTQAALNLCEAKMGLGLREDISIFFDIKPDYHNGLTTVLPTNRIDIETEAPNLESSIGLNSDYLTETITHELSHMTVMQRYGGLFSAFDIFVGNAARPLGLWPRWMHEGLAVWTEAARGGRPNTGYLDFDRRRYADFVQRKKKTPFTNDRLDGNGDMLEAGPNQNLHRIENGALPYHFGYFLMSDIFDGTNPKVSLPDFITASAKNLGMSFRIIFRDEFKVDLDARFQNLQKDWAEVARLPKSNRDTLKPVVVAKEITGPFFSKGDANGHAQSVTWIEESAKAGGTAHLRARIDGEPAVAKLDWNRPFSQPLQAHYLGGKRWLVLAREHPDRGKFFLDNNVPVERKILLLQPDGSLCPVNVNNRIREFSYSQGWLAWVQSSSDGAEVALKAPFNTQVNTEVNGQAKSGCAIDGAPTMIAKSTQSFQRITSVYADATNTLYSITAPNGEKISENLYWNGTRVEESVPLSLALPFNDGLVATAFTAQHWGPVLIARNPTTGVARIKSYLPIKTGAYRTVPAFDKDWFWAKESLWEEDRFYGYKKEDFLITTGTQLIAQGVAARTRGTGATPAKTIADLGVVGSTEIPKVSEDPYGAWPSIWPHFWVPSIIAVTGGFAITGQTFYQDLAQQWQGYTLVGYDSFLKKPIFSTGLNRDHLSWGPINTVFGSAFYTPVSTLFGGQTLVQDRYGISMDLAAGGLVGGFRLSEGLGATFLKANRSPFLAGYSQVIPGLALKLASDKSQNSELPGFLLFKVQHSFSVATNLRYIKQAETFSRFQWQLPLWALGYQFTSEYGWTSKKNFPISYFESGGFPQIATGNTNFLTRGFDYRFVTVREAVRVGNELGIPLKKIGSGLGWNRFSLSDSELRLIGEAVSFTTFNGTRYRVGRQYFSTVGGELDFVGSTIFYVNYRISFGAYHGFGQFGETRYALILRSGLDL